MGKIENKRITFNIYIKLYFTIQNLKTNQILTNYSYAYKINNNTWIIPIPKIIFNTIFL